MQTISLKNNLVTCDASVDLEYGMKCAIFEIISTKTKIKSWHEAFLDKPRTKSKHRSCQGASGMVEECTS